MLQAGAAGVTAFASQKKGVELKGNGRDLNLHLDLVNISLEAPDTVTWVPPTAGLAVDSTEYTDHLGYDCNDWAEEARCGDAGYTPEQSEKLRRNCPVACSMIDLKAERRPIEIDGEFLLNFTSGGGLFSKRLLRARLLAGRGTAVWTLGLELPAVVLNVLRNRGDPAADVRKALASAEVCFSTGWVNLDMPNSAKRQWKAPTEGSDKDQQLQVEFTTAGESSVGVKHFLNKNTLLAIHDLSAQDGEAEEFRVSRMKRVVTRGGVNNTGIPMARGAPAQYMYALQLKPWLDTYRAEQLLVVQKGDLAERPRVTLVNVSAFLGSPHKYAQDKQLKGGATQKPKHRGFSGDAQLPEKLKLELEAFFQPHRAAFAQLLKARKVRITRLTDESKKAYLA